MLRDIPEHFVGLLTPKWKVLHSSMTMRSCYLIFSLIALCATIQAASQVNISQIFSEIPSCALGCVSKGFSTSPSCTLADPTCLCANQTLQADLSVCVQGTCSQADLIPLGVANNQLCAGFPVQSRGSETVVVGIVFISVTLPAIFLRCWSRYSIAKELWWDDWTILAAGMTLIGILVTDIVDVNLGFGEHLWQIQATNDIALLKIFLLSEVLYIVALAFTKVSILLFYLRVFRRPVFRTIVTVIIGFVIASGLAFISAIVFQCNPVAGAWDRTLSAKCIDVNGLAFANSGVSIAQDLIILFLPVSELIGLQMSLRKKLNVLGMFSIGGFACVTSIIRLKFIVSFGNSKDATWDNVTPSDWSIVEICIAMICACLPAIRALLSYWFPSLFEMTSKMTSKNVNSSVHLESKTNWAGGRNPREVDEEIVMMSNVPTHHKAGPIAKFEDLDEIPPPTPPKTPRSPGEYSQWRSAGRGSDEVEFLEAKTAVPLRNVRGNYVKPPMPVAATKSRYAR